MPVILPPLMLLCAIVSATWLAYGIDPNVTSKFGGLALVTLTRRLQWVLILFAILPCLVLIARVSMAKARAWWLIGLSVIVALMFVRFSPANLRPVRVVDASLLPTLKDIKPDSDDEFVVGFELAGNAYAFPYRALFRTPIVQLTDFDRRVILIDSPYANSAAALDVTHEVKADDLEYVSSPQNSTLAYNRKYGQFIVGVTGLTDHGATPIGVRGLLAIERVPLRIWRQWHPASKYMIPDADDATAPGMPLLPAYPIMLTDHSIPPEQPITLIHTDPPVALLDTQSISGPTSLTTDHASLVLWRAGGQLRVFVSTIAADPLTFIVKKDAKGILKLMDRKTNSTWSTEGLCEQGMLKGRRLTAVQIEPDVYWGVSKTWWPNLQIAHLADTQ